MYNPVDSAIHCLNNWGQKAIGSTSVEYSAFFSEPPASLTEKKNFLDNNYPASGVAVIFRLIHESSAGNSSNHELIKSVTKKENRK